MSARMFMSEAEYLTTAFEGPDPEFQDGEVIERNAGDAEHSLVQGLLTVSFEGLRRRGQAHPRVTLTLRLRPGRYRVADFAVFTGATLTGVPERPPLIVAEVVSREDLFVRTMRGLEEYRAWGVRHVWLVDPWMQRMAVYGERGLLGVRSYEVPELGVSLAHEVLFPQGSVSGG